MALNFVRIAHIVAGVFALIELGLTAYLVSEYNGYFYGGYYADGASPDRTNFMLFNAIWSLLVLAYVGLTPLYMTTLFHKLAALALEAVTMIFWFAGSIALAVFIGAPRCGRNTFCGSYEAAVAFGFFLWAIFTFLVVVDAMEAMRSRRSNSTTRGHHTKPYAGA
ncbi:unnamed protein product [Discula destructiva]